MKTLERNVMIISKQNGKNYAVYYEDCVLAFAYADEILNNFVRKATGFSLGNRETAQNFIVIGDCDKSKGIMERYDLSTLGDDGFYIAFENKNIYIFGNTELACVYGVYEFLERYMGIRFLNVDFDYIPQTENIVILEEDVKCVPVFPERSFYSLACFYPDYSEFVHKLRFTGDLFHYNERYGSTKRWFSEIPNSPHNALSYVPKEKYGNTHPEFYCKVSAYEDLCYTNGITDDGEFDYSMDESVAKAIADSLEGYIKNAKTEKYFMFGKPDDKDAACHCERCEKNRAKYGGESGLIIVLLNAVIKEVERRLETQNIQSDFQIVTFAYLSTEKPPVDENFKPVSPKVIPCKRLHIRYAPIDADYTFSLDDKRQNESVSKHIKGWMSLTHNIMIWDYMSNFGEYCWYMYNLHYFKDNLRLYADNKFSYVFNQGSYNVRREWQVEMKSYIASKLYWNLDLSVEDLRTEYVSLYYGPASKTVFEFLKQMDAFFQEKIDNGFHIRLGSAPAFLNYEEYPFEFLYSMYLLLKNGVEELGSSSLSKEERDMYAFRLEMIMLTPMRMLLINKYSYKDFAWSEMEKEFFEIMKKANIEKTGESKLIYLEIGSNQKSDYKIVTSKTPSAEEKLSAEYLQKYFKEKYQFDLPIVVDDWNIIWPSYWSKGIFIGENCIVHEFIKGGFDIADKEYWLQSFGCCMFIMSGTDILSATKYFFENFIKEEDDGTVYANSFYEIKRIEK